MAERNSEFERVPGDDYATPAWVIEALLSVEIFEDPIWEPAPGTGHMVRALEAGGHRVIWNELDFLTYDGTPMPSIISNPPFRLAAIFCRRALEITEPVNGKVAMLLPLAYDTALSRVDLFRDHPAFHKKYIITQRIRWANLPQKAAGPSQNHAWYCWDWRHRGQATLGWIP
jgi:hypothetical protein